MLLNAPWQPSIKSIQRGQFTTTGTSQTISISSVDTTKAIIRVSDGTSDNVMNNIDYAVVFASSTQLTLTVNTWTVGRTINWEVIEFYNVKSLQTGSYVLSTGSGVEQSITISSVDVTKALLFISETTNNATAAGVAINRIKTATSIGVLTWSTTKTIKWQVIEFN